MEAYKQSTVVCKGEIFRTELPSLGRKGKVPVVVEISKSLLPKIPGYFAVPTVVIIMVALVMGSCECI